MKKRKIQKLKTYGPLRNERIQKASNICYKYSLFTVLGVTRAFSRFDLQLPTKWYSMIDSLRASSSIIHGKISTLDRDVEEEFREKEDMLDRRLGNKKFYSEEEVEELQDKINEIEI